MMLGGTVVGSALAALIIRKRWPSGEHLYERLGFPAPV